jgi:hypothetical protein
MMIVTGVIEVTGVMTEVTEVSQARDLNTEAVMMEQLACMLAGCQVAQGAVTWKISLPSMEGMNQSYISKW